jgi:hypothetical protein
MGGTAVGMGGVFVAATGRGRRRLCRTIVSLCPFGHAGRSLPLRHSILLVVVVDPTRGTGVLHPHTALFIFLLIQGKKGRGLLHPLLFRVE